MNSTGVTPKQNQLIAGMGNAIRQHVGLLKEEDTYFDNELGQHVTVKAIGVARCRIQDNAGRMHFRERRYVEVEVRNEKTY